MASYSGVQFQLRVFQAAHERFSQDGNLSAAGRQRALNGLANEIEAYKIQALDILSREWQYSKKRFRELQAERDAAEQAESRRWRYDVLTYEKETLEPEYRAARDPRELQHVFSKHAASGIVERKRAAAELALKYGNVSEAAGLRSQASELLAELTTTPEMMKAEESARVFANRTVDLYGVTQEAGEFYYSSKHEFHLLVSLQLTSHVDVTNMVYSYEVCELEEQQPEPA